MKKQWLVDVLYTGVSRPYLLLKNEAIELHFSLGNSRNTIVIPRVRTLNGERFEPSLEPTKAHLALESKADIDTLIDILEGELINSHLEWEHVGLSRKFDVSAYRAIPDSIKFDGVEIQSFESDHSRGDVVNENNMSALIKRLKKR